MSKRSSRNPQKLIPTNNDDSTVYVYCHLNKILTEPDSLLKRYLHLEQVIHSVRTVSKIVIAVLRGRNICMSSNGKQ